MFSRLFEIVREEQIKKVVERRGCLVVATHNTDYDEQGNFIGDYSEAFKIARKYMKE